VSRSSRGSWQGRGTQPAALIADRQQRARQLQSRSYKRGRAAIPAQVRNAGTARLERERKEPV
jgi:hypothetical protein